MSKLRALMELLAIALIVVSLLYALLRWSEAKDHGTKPRRTHPPELQRPS